MSKSLRYVLLALGCMLVLLIVIPLLIPTENIRQAAEKLASDAAGMPVKIAGLSLRALPAPAMSVAGLKIIDTKGGTPKLAVAAGSISLALKPLFGGRVELTAVSFRNITLRVSEQAGKTTRTIHIDKVTGSVKWAGGKLELPRWKARLYSGTAYMDAELSPLKGAGRKLSGRVKATGIQLRSLLTDVAGIEKVSGMLSSTLDVEATGAEAKAMLGSLRVDGPIHMADVKIAKMDASHVLKDNKPGQVKLQLKQKPAEFKFLNMVLHMRGKDASLEDIALYSSRLEATGKITVKNGSQLEGRISPSGLPGLIGMTMLVSGTLEHPEMHAAPPAMKGAAADASAETKPEDKQ